MKKILIFILLVFLVQGISMPSFGAIHDRGSYCNTTDHWYSIKPETPYLEIDAAEIQPTLNAYGFQYYANDQSFFNYNSVSIANNTIDDINASYLTKCGFFIGFSYLSNPGTSIVGAGFRFPVQGPSYLAVSVDNLAASYNPVTQEHDSRLLGYEANLRIYVDYLKLSGDFYYPEPQPGQTEVETDLSLAGAFQIFRCLTIGGDWEKAGTATTYSYGLTLDPAFFVLDLQVGKCNAV